MTIKVGDYIRLTHSILGDPGKVVPVVNVADPTSRLIKVKTGRKVGWIYEAQYEEMTPFEQAVYRRLKESSNEI